MASQYIELDSRTAAPSRLDRLKQAVTGSSDLTRLVAFLAIAVTVERIWLGQGVPLWLDETWTAMIATRPDWASFWREAYLDVNAPFYYVFMKLWTGVFGISNTALRLPSLLFIYAAAALPLLWRAHGLDRKAALVWGALMLLWWPGIIMSIDARTYGLLLFASAAGAIAFIQAMRSLRTGYFVLWAAIGAVQMFSHYFAYFLVATQGLFLLWRWRIELVKRWYAFAPFAIPFAWTAYHLPRVLEYGKPGIAWYQPTDFDAAINFVVFSFGAPSKQFPLILLLALAGALWKSGWQLADNRSSVRPAPEGASQAINQAVLAAIVALAVVLVLGTLKASLADRYIVPVVPSMLLGVVLLAGRIPRFELACSLVLIVFGTFALKFGAVEKALADRSVQGFEQASEFIAVKEPNTLIFLTDYTNTPILDENSMERLGEFFLVRNGQVVKTQTLRLKKFDDPNAVLRQAVNNRQGTAFIWVYDAQYDLPTKRHPPRFSSDADWRCFDNKSYRYIAKEKKTLLSIGTLACSPANRGKRL